MYNSALWTHSPFSSAERLHVASGFWIDSAGLSCQGGELNDGDEGSPSSREDLGGKWPKSQGRHSGCPEKEEQRARGYSSRKHLDVLQRKGSKEPDGVQVLVPGHYTSVILSQSPR